MSDYYAETEHTARKEHRCAEAGAGCARTAAIRPGTRYVRCFGVTDGRGWTQRLCLRCARLYRKVHDRYMRGAHPEDGPVFGSLRAWLRGVR